MAQPVSPNLPLFQSNEVLSNENRTTFTVRSLNGHADHPIGLIFFDQRCRLGKGGFGEVLGGFVNGRQSPRAIKVLTPPKKWDLPGNLKQENFLKEVQILFEMKGAPHCMQIRGGVRGANGYDPISDRVPGVNLYEQASKERFSADDIILIFYQSLLALQEIHKRKFIHCDVKGENMIFDPESKHLTMIDFGLALKVLDDQLRFSGLCRGTFPYLAPESFMGQDFSYESDLAGLAITLFELYANRKEKPLLNVAQPIIPFTNDEIIKLRLKAILSIFGTPPSEWIKKSKPLSDFLRLNEAGQVEGNDGFSIPPLYDWKSEIRNQGTQRGDSPFVIEEFLKLLENLLVYENRIKIEEALKSPFFQELYDFKIRCCSNLPTRWHLTLYERGEFGERAVATYPCRQWVNDTMFHLKNQSKDKGGVYHYRLTEEREGERFQMESGKVRLVPGGSLHIDTKASAEPNVRFEPPSEKES